MLFACVLAGKGRRQKKVVLLGGAHHKVASPPPSCGQSTTFLWDIFYLLRIR